MRKPIVILGLLGLLALFFAACGSGGDSTGERRDEGGQPPGLTAVAPTSVPEPTAVPKPTAESPSDGSALGGALNPFSLLSGSLFSGTGPSGLPASSGEADPALKAALLTLEDLPPGYADLQPGGMSFSFETDQGSMSMAASMFTKGESADQFPESMVMSAVVAASGDLLEQSLGELRRYTDPAELEREIENALGAGQVPQGIGIEDVRVLDASGLGEGGVGLHMVMTMDLGQLAEEFGASMPPEAEFLKEGLAFDMYVFARGDRLLMVMSMWPGAGPSPLDIRALAEVMDQRAEAAF
jgi:hypothetical protein